MKGLFSILVGGILLFPSPNYAGDPSRLVPPGPEAAVFQLIGGIWVDIGSIGNPTAAARAFMGSLAAGDGNKERWTINVRNNATVDESVVADTISGSSGGWNWVVRNPGCYAATLASVVIKSNYDIDMLFAGFEDLVSQDTGVSDTISVRYAFWNLGTPPPPDDPAWMRAADLNGLDMLFQDSEALHQGIVFKLWGEICVPSTNPPAEYQDDAQIAFVAKRIKHWIDPETGLFVPISSW